VQEAEKKKIIQKNYKKKAPQEDYEVSQTRAASFS